MVKLSGIASLGGKKPCSVLSRSASMSEEEDHCSRRDLHSYCIPGCRPSTVTLADQSSSAESVTGCDNSQDRGDSSARSSGANSGLYATLVISETSVAVAK